jgi:Na+-translocating ferredoxin:NAD+ oxidoreductase RnfG subunit
MEGKFIIVAAIIGGMCYFLPTKEVIVEAHEIHPHYTELLSHNEALEFIFGEDAQIEKEKITLDEDTREEIEEEMGFDFNLRYDKEFDFYIAKKEGKIFRYAAIQTVPGKVGPLTFIIGLTPDGKVYDLAVMSYNEEHQKELAEENFLGQFKGKSINDDLKLGRDIQGISETPISSREMTHGVKKILYVFKTVFLDKEE